MNKFSLIFDFNYICNKSLFVAKGYEKRSKPYLNANIEQEQLARKISTDFIHDISLFNGYDKVICCKDSKIRWRKKYCDTYKANRKKSTDVNWDAFYSIIDDVCDLLQKQGIIISQLDGAEGDDLMYFWSKYLNKLKQNAIVITGDSDLSQLVDFNKEIFTITYNNNSKKKEILVKYGFLKFIESLKKDIDITDFFNMNNSILSGQDPINMINIMIQSSETKEIDPLKIVLNKILLGDKSDNILPIWSWMGKTNKPIRVTEKYIIPIYEKIDNKLSNIKSPNDILQNDEILNDICETIEKIGKIKIGFSEFRKNFQKNLKLIYLHRSQIPDDLIENFMRSVKNIDFENHRINKFDIKSLLKDTRYEKNVEFISGIFD